MHFFWSTRRALARAVCLVAFSLLGVSLAEAAPGLARRPGGRTCEPQATAVRKQLRRPKSFGGPLRTHRRFGVDRTPGPRSRVHRPRPPAPVDDDEAIQNDAPAAQIDGGDCPVPELGPIGVLARVVDATPITHTFSPRSPRGPPPRA